MDTLPLILLIIYWLHAIDQRKRDYVNGIKSGLSKDESANMFLTKKEIKDLIKE